MNGVPFPAASTRPPPGELVPHAFGVNRMPTGQRGWYMFKRVGADSVNDAGFRILDKSA
jgi:predicted phage gp36 major capsid-like protein